MNRVAKLVTGICLGIIVMVGINVTAQAKTEYYVTNNAVYAVDSKNPYFPVQLAPGTVIPSNSTVYVNLNATKFSTNYGMFDYTADKTNVYVLTTNTWGAVGYDNQGIVSIGNSFLGGYTTAAIAQQYVAPCGWAPSYCYEPYCYGYAPAYCAYAPYYWGHVDCEDVLYAEYVYKALSANGYLESIGVAPAVTEPQPQVSVDMTTYSFEVEGVNYSFDFPEVVLTY